MATRRPQPLGLYTLLTIYFLVIHVAGAPGTQLVITQNPSASTVAGSGFAQSIIVEVRDGTNTLDGTSTASVTLTVTTGTGSLLATGSVTRAAVAGVADFTSEGLYMTTAGTGKIITATSGGLTSAATATFDITAAAANKWAVSLQPTDVQAGTFISATAEIQDTYGNARGTGSTSATLSLDSGTGTLYGILTRSAENGVVNFCFAFCDIVGAKTLRISGGGLTDTVTNSFNILAGPASRIAITVQPPTTITAGTPFGLTAQIQDSGGNLVTSATNQLRVGVTPGLVGSIIGTVTQTAVGGVATWNDLQLSNEQSDSTIRLDVYPATSPSTLNITNPNSEIAIETLTPSSKHYIDRTYTLNAGNALVSAFYGHYLIKTKNNNKAQSDNAVWTSFDISGDAIVYAMYDRRFKCAPNWLRDNFTPEVTVTEVQASNGDKFWPLYKHYTGPATLTFGANRATGWAPTVDTNHWFLVRAADALVPVVTDSISVNITGSLSLSGTLTNSINEHTLRTSGGTLMLGLSGDTWVAAGAAFDGERAGIIAGFTSSETLGGWSSSLVPIPVTNVVRINDTHVTITVDPAPSYYTHTADVVQIVLPHTAFTGGGGYLGEVTISDQAPTATLTGTLSEVNGNTESAVVLGGKTLDIILTGGLWQAAGTLFDAQRAAILAGITPNPPVSWIGSDIGPVSAAGSLTITPTGYSVQGSGNDIWGNIDEFYFAYTQVSGDIEISGLVKSISNTHNWAKSGFMIRDTLANNSRHAMIVTTPGSSTAFQFRTNPGGSSTNMGISHTPPMWLKLTRTGNDYKSYVSADGVAWTFAHQTTLAMTDPVYVGIPITSHNDGAISTAELEKVTLRNNGLLLQPVPTRGWSAMVAPALQPSHVVRVNDTTVRVTLPAVAGYSIQGDELLSITVPSAAIEGTPGSVVASTTISLKDEPVSAVVSGYLGPGVRDEATLRAGGNITVTLLNDIWRPSANGEFDTVRSVILNGMTCDANSNAYGWDNKIKPLITINDVHRVSDRVVDIVVPPAPEYAISVSEALTFTIAMGGLVGTDSVFNASYTFLQDLPVTITAFTGNVSEWGIIHYNQTVTVSIENDHWDNSAPGPWDTARSALATSLTCNTSTATGFSVSLYPQLTKDHIRATSDQSFTITIPRNASYGIDSTEFLFLTVPAVAVRGSYSSASSTALQIPAYLGPSLPPTNLRVNNSVLNGVNNSAVLLWDPPVYNGMPVTGYRLYHNKGNGSLVSPTDHLTDVSGPQMNVYELTDTGVYRFLVVSLSSYGFQGYSNLATLQLTPSPKSSVTSNPASIPNMLEGVSNTTLALSLPTQPTSDVTVTLSMSEPDVNPSPSTLTFTSVNWASEQSFTLFSTVNDNVAFNVFRQLSIATASADWAYDQLSSSMQLEIIDTSAAIVVSPALPSTVLKEADTSVTLTLSVSLSGLIVNPVTITATSTASGTQVAMVPNTALTFTNVDWSVPQTITVAAHDDSVVEASQHSANIDFSSVSASSNWNFPSGSPSIPIKIDDDDAGVTMTPDATASVSTPLPLAEDGTTKQEITLVLLGEPQANVVFKALADAQVAVSVATVTFTPTNWNAIQTITVTAVDDTLWEGALPHAGQVEVQLDAGNSDSSFVSQIPTMSKTFHFAVTDDDALATPTLSINSVTNNTAENGDPFTVSALFTVLPFTDPLVAPVMNMTASSSDPSRLLITPAIRGVTGPQAAAGAIDFTVTPVRNYIADAGAEVTVTIALRWTPTDIVLTKKIMVSNVDVIGLNVTKPAGVTSENGASTTFTAFVTSKPSTTVTCALSVSDSTEISLPASTVEFTADASWSVPRTITVTGLDDTEADSLQISHVSLGSCTGDASFAALSANVSVTTLDNEGSEFGFQFAATANTTNESPEVAPVEINVALSEAPSASASTVIKITSSDTKEGQVVGDPLAMTFTASTWSVVQTAQVRGVQDDGTIDGDKKFDVSLIKSGESNGAIVHMTNLDDDAEVLMVDKAGLCFSNEQADPYLLAIRLGGLPTEDVTVSVSQDISTHLSITPKTLAFTPSTYSVVQTVTITGIKGHPLPSSSAKGVQVSIKSTTASSSGFFSQVTYPTFPCFNEPILFPEVSSLLPDTLKANEDTIVTITGGFFVTDQATLPRVYFNEHLMPLNAVTNSSIEVVYQAAWAQTNSTISPAAPATSVSLLQTTTTTTATASGKNGFRLDGWVTVKIVNGKGARWVNSERLYVATRCTGEGERLDPKTDSCVSCPVGMVCKGGGRVEGEDGFFVPEGAEEAVQCRPPQRCGGEGGTGGCSPGYSGVGCAHCDTGYFKEGQLCKKCSDDSGVQLLALLSSALAIIALAGLFVFAALTCRDETFTDLIDAVAAVQLVQAIGRMSNPNLPSFMATFYRHLSIVTLEYEAVGAGCNGNSTGFISTFWATLVFVLGIIIPVIILFTLFGIAMLGLEHRRITRKILAITAMDDPQEEDIQRKHKLQTRLDQKKFFVRNRIVRVAVISLVLVYVTLTTVALKAIHCIKIGDYSYLSVDFSVRCYSGEHMQVALVAWTLIVVYVAGFPIGSSVYLFVNRNVIYTNPVKKARYGFLFEELKPKAYWFASLAMSTEAALAIGAVIFAEDPLMQLVVSGGMLTLYFLVVLIVLPFRKMIENILVLFASFVGILASGLNYASGTNQPWGDTVYFSLSVTVFALCIMVLILSTLMIFNAITRGRRAALRMKLARRSLRKAKIRIRLALLNPERAKTKLSGPALEAYLDWIGISSNKKRLLLAINNTVIVDPDVSDSDSDRSAKSATEHAPALLKASDLIVMNDTARSGTSSRPISAMSIPGSTEEFLHTPLNLSSKNLHNNENIQTLSSRELPVYTEGRYELNRFHRQRVRSVDGDSQAGRFEDLLGFGGIGDDSRTRSGADPSTGRRFSEMFSSHRGSSIRSASTLSRNSHAVEEGDPEGNAGTDDSGSASLCADVSSVDSHSPRPSTTPWNMEQGNDASPGRARAQLHQGTEVLQRPSSIRTPGGVSVHLSSVASLSHRDDADYLSPTTGGSSIHPMASNDVDSTDFNSHDMFSDSGSQQSRQGNVNPARNSFETRRQESEHAEGVALTSLSRAHSLEASDADLRLRSSKVNPLVLSTILELLSDEEGVDDRVSDDDIISARIPAGEPAPRHEGARTSESRSSRRAESVSRILSTESITTKAYPSTHSVSRAVSRTSSTGNVRTPAADVTTLSTLLQFLDDVEAQERATSHDGTRLSSNELPSGNAILDKVLEEIEEGMMDEIEQGLEDEDIGALEAELEKLSDDFSDMR